MYHKRYTTVLTKAITAITKPNNAPMIALRARTATPLEMLTFPMGMTKSIYGINENKAVRIFPFRFVIFFVYE